MDQARFRSELEEGKRDFPGIDLSGANLSRLDMRGINLREANLSECTLYRSDFRPHPDSKVKADLSGARLDRARMRKVLLIDADLSGASLPNVEAFAGIFVRASFDFADLSGALLRDADMRSCTLESAILQEADVSRSVLRGTNIEGADFSKAILLATNLLYASGRPASVEGCQITAGTCELSNWGTSHIGEWLEGGAKLERWPMPELAIPETSDTKRRHDSLYGYLTARFSLDELRLFVWRHWKDESIHLPEGDTTIPVFVMALIDAAERRGLINRRFFDELISDRPHSRNEVDSIARLWLK